MITAEREKMLSTAQEVPFFCYPNVFLREEMAFTRIFQDVGRRGAFILQRELADFERRLAEFTGSAYAVGVANATDGLHLALRAAGLDAGDEVILSSHTMIATAAAIHFAGGVPVPVDPGSDHLIDPEQVARAVTPRTRAIMPTQLNGRTANMDRLQGIADQHGLLIVEDAAQALGARYRDRCAGTFGVASAISFYPAKVLGCLGDGGAVLTSDDQVYECLLQLRDHGRDRDGNLVCWGLNSRLDNLQAALLDHQLDTYGDVITRRRQMAGLYDRRLGAIPELVLPPSPQSDPSRFDIYQNYEIEAERRDELQEFLAQRGVGTLVQWGGQAVHAQRELGFTQQLPHTDRLFTRLLMLPLNMSLADEDIDRVCGLVTEFYGR
jgi:dTDP-4-amino-4,6-dideoxygalactose transaminase